jgi:hypothetical protein
MSATSSCTVPECTFAATGICLQNHVPAECPNLQVQGATRPGAHISAEAAVEFTAGRADIGGSVLPRPDDLPRLPASTTLALQRAENLRAKRRATTVGILGLPNSGKTACLVSMYLLAAKGQLAGFTCVNSETLLAFELISRGARRWSEGNQPQQMTAHTDVADDRQAGFLHLRLQRDIDQHVFDFLLPDLPGEWSKSLIDKAEAGRFEFLKAASAIWVMVDGRQLIDSKSQQYALYRAECLLERLASLLLAPRPKIILVSSWHDHGEIPEDALSRLRAAAARLELNFDVAAIASFSDSDLVAPGTGIAALLNQTLASSAERPAFWPDAPVRNLGRAVLNFRLDP